MNKQITSRIRRGLSQCLLKKRYLGTAATSLQKIHHQVTEGGSRQTVKLAENVLKALLIADNG